MKVKLLYILLRYIIYSYFTNVFSTESRDIRFIRATLLTPSSNNARDVPPPPDLHSRPGKWRVRDRRAYGWLPTTGERIVTSRIVHVAVACNDRSLVAAAGTTTRTTTPVTTVRNFSASMRRDVSHADKLLDLSCARATRLIQFVRGAIAQRGIRSIDVTFVSPERGVFVDEWRGMTDWKRIDSGMERDALRVKSTFPSAIQENVI